MTFSGCFVWKRVNLIISSSRPRNISFQKPIWGKTPVGPPPPLFYEHSLSEFVSKVLPGEGEEGQDGLMGYSTMLLSLQHCCRIMVLHISDINLLIFIFVQGLFILGTCLAKASKSRQHILQYLTCILFNTEFLPGQIISCFWWEQKNVQITFWPFYLPFPFSFCNLICQNFTYKGDEWRPGMGGCGHCPLSLQQCSCVRAFEILSG